MANIALIACTKTKHDAPSRAQLLYNSPLYRKSLLYALSTSERHYILSAKHFLLDPEAVISPYEKTIAKFSKREKNEWGTEVSIQLRRYVSPEDHLIMLCGREYYAPIVETIRLIGCKTSFPLLGLSLGNRLKELSHLNGEAELRSTFELFNRSMRRLYIGQDGGRLLGESTGRLNWPKRGVYFLIEPDEFLATRRYSPLLNRIGRIGTHAVSRGSKTTLWDRLSTHRGITSGGGSHRSSIFRLHVGAALAAKHPARAVATWGLGQVAPEGAHAAEIELEREVSRFMSQLRVLWLDVPDEPSPQSDRAFLERNAIGLLSRYNVAFEKWSSKWLGYHSENLDIASSGLWNLNHLYLRPHADFMRVFDFYVGLTLGENPAPSASIAPASWYGEKRRIDSGQLALNLDGPKGSATRS